MDYHNHRFEDYSLMVFKDDSLYALLPANKVGSKLYCHQGLTYGSFILHEKATLLNAFEAFKGLLQFLHSAGIEQLEIKVIPTFYNLIPSDELIYFLYKAKAQLIKRDLLMVIDYNHPLPFQKNRREGINKARRNGLKVTIDTNFEGFWNEVLIPNLRHKHQVNPVHSLEEIQKLALNFPDNIKQVSVYKDNKIIAGTTIFLTKTTVHPQYVSGNAAKNMYGSLDLAYDFVIHHFKEGRRYFDFNISSEENGTVLNTGLIFWKETCGARAFAADNYLVETASYKSLNLAIK
ncbi:MAG: GNAT family N-acetyltransferase [Flavobacteriaceae bacterium]